MTAPVSVLFITMIPIDCKITKIFLILVGRVNKSENARKIKLTNDH